MPMEYPEPPAGSEKSGLPKLVAQIREGLGEVLRPVMKAGKEMFAIAKNTAESARLQVLGLFPECDLAGLQFIGNIKGIAGASVVVIILIASGTVLYTGYKVYPYIQSTGADFSQLEGMSLGKNSKSNSAVEKTKLPMMKGMRPAGFDSWPTEKRLKWYKDGMEAECDNKTSKSNGLIGSTGLSQSCEENVKARISELAKLMKGEERKGKKVASALNWIKEEEKEFKNEQRQKHPVRAHKTGLKLRSKGGREAWERELKFQEQEKKRAKKYDPNRKAKRARS